MPNEYYVGYNTIHKLVKSLSNQIVSSGYEPDVIVAIGSGGFIPARIMKTYINRPIFTVGISYYGVDQQHFDYPKKIQWIDEAGQQLSGKRILLIDEVDDTRVTLSYCIEELLQHTPKEIAVAVLQNKRKAKGSQFPAGIKFYFAAEEIEDLWIKYPWDAIDIDEHLKMCGKKEIDYEC
ncbi:MAG: phosphoribosyltransferase [Sphaerochaetaceae bacterium]